MTRGSTSHSEQCKKTGKQRQNCRAQKPRGSTSQSEPSQNWDDTSKPEGTDARELASLSGHLQRIGKHIKNTSLILSLKKTPQHMDILSQAETQSKGDLGTSWQAGSTQNNDAPAPQSIPKVMFSWAGYMGGPRLHQEVTNFSWQWARSWFTYFAVS